MDETYRELKDAQILLVDDQPANLDVLCELLESEGCRIALAPNGPIALKIAADILPNLILLDVMMPEMDGFAVCRRLKQDSRTRSIPVIFITAKNLKDDIIAGFRAGGVDYITKPFQDEEVLVRLQTHLQINRLAGELSQKNRELADKNQALEKEIAQRKALKGKLSILSKREAEHWGLEGFVGQSPTVEQIFKEIRLMQENAAMSVLISGESGTGKELIARAIHFGSARSEEPFVPVNCAAMPSELAESLLFGHVKGAFTGAEADRAGHFELAHKGTLFLDELGEMPLELQAKLLRVLEDGEVRPVGANQGKRVDVRILAATNVDLRQRIQQGSFRQDLYFRLARYTVNAPALRQRQEDIPLLAQHFLQLFSTEMGREVPPLSEEVTQSLLAYPFPGNVRELKNIIERALIESGGKELRTYHLHYMPHDQLEKEKGPAAPVPELPLDLEQAELWVIKRAIAKARGNISEAARLLGTHRNRIYRALAQEEHQI